jgi:hypothetical protein
LDEHSQANVEQSAPQLISSYSAKPYFACISPSAAISVSAFSLEEKMDES